MEPRKTSRRLTRGLRRSVRRLLLLGTLAGGVMGLPSEARGQTDLGGQRVATSSGTFLKIGLDARGAGVGGSYAPIVRGSVATFYNPAGILTEATGPSIQFNLVQWPADLQIGSVSVSRPFPRAGVTVAAGIAYLGTTLDETTEFYPAGTGRTVGYSDFLATASVARSFITDKLGIGISLKYLREDLGSDVGGPLIHGVLMDAGTGYSLGWRNARISVTLSDFGPDLDPSGSFSSHVTGDRVSYGAFSPPTQFQLGLALDPWITGPHRLTSSTVIMHQADNAETVRSGLEYLFRDSYALRSGYDFSADEMDFSGGLGLVLRLGERRGSFDYAYTAGGHLAAVHRLSLGFQL